MNLELLEQIDILVDLIKNDPRYKDYILYKKIIENDEELIKLVIKKDNYINELTDLRKFDKDNLKKELELLKNIKETKEKIDSLTVVKEYKEKENKYNELIDLINNNLFKI